MTDGLDAVPAERFAEVWELAATPDEAVVAIRQEVGRNVPRWAILARSVAEGDEVLNLSGSAGAVLRKAEVYEIAEQPRKEAVQ